MKILPTKSIPAALSCTGGAPALRQFLQVRTHGRDEPGQSVGLWPELDSVHLELTDEVAAVLMFQRLGVLRGAIRRVAERPILGQAG